LDVIIHCLSDILLVFQAAATGQESIIERNDQKNISVEEGYFLQPVFE
jgi:hypothetical protein